VSYRYRGYSIYRDTNTLAGTTWAFQIDNYDGAPDSHNRNLHGIATSILDAKVQIDEQLADMEDEAHEREERA
jgi:hypothetical protein